MREGGSGAGNEEENGEGPVEEEDSILLNGRSEIKRRAKSSFVTKSFTKQIHAR